MALPTSAAIVYRSASSAENGGGTTSLTINTPAGAAVGDVLIASIDVRTSASNACNVDIPGWTKIAFTSSTATLRKDTFYTVLTSAPPASYTFSFFGTFGTSCSGTITAKASGGIIAYTGVDTSSPIDASAAQENASSTSLSAPSVTTTAPNTMIIAMFGLASGAGISPFAGSPMTERYEATSSGGGAAGTKATSQAQDVIQTAAGASGAKAALSSAAAVSIGHTVALKPLLSNLNQTAYRWFTNTNKSNFTTVTSNPTTTTDAVYASVSDGTSMYVTGYDGTGGFDWRVEKRDLADGTLVSGFGTGGVLTTAPSVSNDRVWGIDQDSSFVYLAGMDSAISSTDQRWRIEKRDKTTGALVSGFGTGGVVTNNPTSGIDVAYEIKVDGSFMYISGTDSTGLEQWRVEKRDITTGALVSGFGTGGVIVGDHGSQSDQAIALTLDGTDMYVGGTDSSPGTNNQIRIEKRDRTTGALITGFGTGGVYTNNPSTASVTNGQIDDGILFKGLKVYDTDVYFSGTNRTPGNLQWHIGKLNKTTGVPVSGFGTSGVVTSNPSAGDDTATSLAVDVSGVYVGGIDKSLDGGLSQFRLEKRDLTSGALVSGFGTGGVVLNNPSTSNDEGRDVILGTNDVYQFGYDSAPGNLQWRVYKFDKLTGGSPKDFAAPLAAQNTPATGITNNQGIRLRMLVRVNSGGLGLSEANLNLQYAERSGTCDVSFSGEAYVNVTTATPIAFLDNLNIADRQDALVNPGDPTDGANQVVSQAYVESNGFSNSRTSLALNTNGLWDIALKNNNAPDGRTYCLRIVDSLGQPLSTYTNIAEIATPVSNIDQSSYRFYENADSLTPGTPLTTQNTASTIAPSLPFRLRQLLGQTQGPRAQNAGLFKLQYAEKSGTCDPSFSGEVYADIQTSSSTATMSATSAVNDASIGSRNWSSPEEVYSSNDTYASVVDIDAVGATNYLKATGFNLNVPAGATITGIKVDMEVNGQPLVFDSSVRLVVNGTSGSSDNRAQATGWPSSDSIRTYGGASDVWRAAGLSVSDVNNPGFGVAISVDSTDVIGASIDHITMTAHYTLPGTGAISYYDNATATNNATISSTANDPTSGARPKVLQTYRETDPFTNSVAAIPEGSDGLWDFALNSSSTAAGKIYCLRTVTSDNSLLNSYTSIPEITFGTGGGGPVGPTLDQQLRGGQSVTNGQKLPFSL